MVTEQTESDDLQFEQADYGEVADAGGGCATCKSVIADAYYDVDGEIVCPSCHSSLVKTLTGGSRVARVLRATFGGLFMGAFGAFIYFLVAKLTGYEIDGSLPELARECHRDTHHRVRGLSGVEDEQAQAG